MKKSITFIHQLGVVAVAFFIAFSPLFASARTFNPQNIFSDEELFNGSALSQAAIQVFLSRENSVLANYSQAIDGQTKTAAQMIWEVGQKYGVNQKFILTTLEKEQALISRTSASQKALDWATGYSCYGGTCKDKYQGFFNQIDASADTQKIYRDKAGQFSFRVGQTTTTFDGYPVTPANQATANLYIYTPHVGNAPELGISQQFGGNKLFWRIWHRYFSHQKFLDGQVITDNTNYWLVSNNKKRLYASRELFLREHKEGDTIFASTNDLAAYETGTPIQLTNNTVVKSSASGQMFLLAGNIRRPILDTTALALLTNVRVALGEGDVTPVTEDQLATYQVGSEITAQSIYPQGKLFRDETGAMWNVQDGLKHLVDPAVLQTKFSSVTPEITSSTNLAGYPTGQPEKLPDGTFVLTNGMYYLISNGERMRIADEGIFNRVFGPAKKQSALTVSSALLEAHIAGEMIDYVDDTIIDLPSASAPVVSGAAAAFESITPESLIMVNGETRNITVTFKNTGGTAWTRDNVTLTATDKGKAESTFGTLNNVHMAETSVVPGQNATFALTLTAPTQTSGLLNQEFHLLLNNVELTSIAKFIIVKPGISAQLVSHTLPIAVKNIWKPVTVTMKIKNTSANTVWLSNKTALEIRDANGKQSPFYDKNDWVRTEVAAVPINAREIKPGGIGEFTFTLDPRTAKKGIHVLNIQLKLLDKNKQVYLDGQLEWKREIRVD